MYKYNIIIPWEHAYIHAFNILTIGNWDTWLTYFWQCDYYYVLQVLAYDCMQYLRVNILLSHIVY